MARIQVRLLKNIHNKKKSYRYIDIMTEEIPPQYMYRFHTERVNPLRTTAAYMHYA